MGFIRGGLLVIASVLLFIGFFLMNSLWIVSNSLEYENIQEELVPIVTETLEEQINLDKIVGDKLEIMKSYCENNSEFVFRTDELTFDISCESIAKGNDAIIEEAIEDSVEKIYYTDYKCNFIECLTLQKSKPYFLISEQTKDYFEQKFYLILLICLAISAGIFFLVENKTNSFFLIGTILLIPSLIFMKLENIINLFTDKPILQFLTFLFAKSSAIAIKGIIISIILILVGIILKFFKVGFWISEKINELKINTFQKEKQEEINQKNKIVKKKNLKNKK